MNDAAQNRRSSEQETRARTLSIILSFTVAVTGLILGLAANVAIGYRVAIFLLTIAAALLVARRWARLETRLHGAVAWIEGRGGVFVAGVFTAAAAALILGQVVSQRSTDPVRARASAKLAQPVRADVAIRNNSAPGTSFGSDAQVYLQDDLTLRALIRNTGERKLQSLHLYVGYLDSDAIGGGGKFVLATSEGNGPIRPVPGSEASVIAPDQGIDCWGAVHFFATGFEQEGTGIRATAMSHYAGTFKALGATATVVGAASVGNLDKTATRAYSIGIYASDAGDADPLNFDGGPNVRIRTSGTREWTTLARMRSGTQVDIDITVSNGSCTPATQMEPVRVRAQTVWRQTEGALYITGVVGALGSSTGKTVGTAIVSSPSSTHPLRLRVLTRTTKLYKMLDESPCTQWMPPVALPEGVARAGVSIGTPMAYKPRDPCHGGAFAEIVRFSAVVAAVK